MSTKTPTMPTREVCMTEALYQALSGELREAHHRAQQDYMLAREWNGPAKAGLALREVDRLWELMRRLDDAWGGAE